MAAFVVIYVLAILGMVGFFLFCRSDYCKINIIYLR